MNKIALFGAAGAIGQSVAEAFSAQGAPYRVVGRSRDALAAAFGADRSPRSSRGIRKIRRPSRRPRQASTYCLPRRRELLAIRPPSAPDATDARRRHRGGREHVVLIGTVYPYGRPRTTPVVRTTPASRIPSRAACARLRRISCSPRMAREGFRRQCCVCLTSTVLA